MPEGHTIHRIARDHRHWFAGERVVACSPQGRFSDGAEQISGRILEDAFAHGKHLFYRWDDQSLTHIHLGLYGKFRNHRSPPPEPRGAVRLRVIAGKRAFDLNGPNRCEQINQPTFQLLVDRLGEDPLQKESDPELVFRAFQKSRATLGSLLLNQSVIAGIGNVYRAELLYLLRIHPDSLGRNLSRKRFDELWTLTRQLLRQGVKYNRIITVENLPPGVSAGRLKSGERLNIYKREVCPDCHRPVQSWISSGRKIYACTRCQVRLEAQS